MAPEVLWELNINTDFCLSLAPLVCAAILAQIRCWLYLLPCLYVSRS